MGESLVAHEQFLCHTILPRAPASRAKPNRYASAISRLNAMIFSRIASSSVPII